MKKQDSLATAAKLSAVKTKDGILTTEERKLIIGIMSDSDATFTETVREIVKENEIDAEDKEEIRKLYKELVACGIEALDDAPSARTMVSRVFCKLGLRQRAEREKPARATFEACDDAKRAFANLLGDCGDIARLPDSFWRDIAKLAGMQDAGALKSSMLTISKTSKSAPVVKHPVNVVTMPKSATKPAGKPGKSLAASVAAKIAALPVSEDVARVRAAVA